MKKLLLLVPMMLTVLVFFAAACLTAIGDTLMGAIEPAMDRMTMYWHTL